MSSPSVGGDGVSAVEVRGLSKVFNVGRQDAVEALVDIDLSISPGEFVSLIGPSGCGKSTQLRLIANLTEPTTGAVMVNGKSARAARLDQDYGMAFQQAGLFEWRSVAKNVELPLELKGWDKARRHARALEMLELVKLPEFAEHFPWQLSGGMQQRVAIARALARRPAVLLMDEPFGSLDALTRHELEDALLQVWGEVGATILFVTHDIEEAIYLADRVHVLSGRPSRVLEQIEDELRMPDPDRGVVIARLERFTEILTGAGVDMSRRSLIRSIRRIAAWLGPMGVALVVQLA